MLYESVDVKENETLIKENEYLRRNRDKAYKEVLEILNIAKIEQPEEVNLIERLENILDILKGEENDA